MESKAGFVSWPKCEAGPRLEVYMQNSKKYFYLYIYILFKYLYVTTGWKKLWKSQWCVPFTATFSKRRKTGALWSERCDQMPSTRHLKELKVTCQAFLLSLKNPELRLKILSLKISRSWAPLRRRSQTSTDSDHWALSSSTTCGCCNWWKDWATRAWLPTGKVQPTGGKHTEGACTGSTWHPIEVSRTNRLCLLKKMCRQFLRLYESIGVM